MNLLDGIKDQSTRIVNDYDVLHRLGQSLRELNLRTVVTIGTFDMIHIGHSRYLERAKGFGDVLIVGVDSDRAVKIYKDETRPLVPQSERLEMLLHTKHVDFVTLVDDVDAEGEWQYGLIEAMRPSVFVAVQDSYPEAQLAEIIKYCDDVHVLPRQAETSTSENLRKAIISQTQGLSTQLRTMADQLDRGELKL